MNENCYVKPVLWIYRLAQFIALILSAFIFKLKICRNEVKDIKGSFVIVANHECALDFVNLIGATRRPMTFVLSNSFYNSLPIKRILDSIGVIPKQQFQTTTGDMKKIKNVINSGEPLVIYPAGLMCEDGLSTPIPRATYKFLKWLGADVYAARTRGSYFVMPKWTSGFRSGRTYLDIYKLFDKDELKSLPVSAIRERTEQAILFDAYREQEGLLVKYKNNDNLNGLENVLYKCPCCMSEYTIEVADRSILRCRECGYEEQTDEYGFLHKTSSIGSELRYVSDWSKFIYNHEKELFSFDGECCFSAKAKIHMLDYNKHKFVEVGSGTLSLSRSVLSLCGTIKDTPFEFSLCSSQFPSLPFSPGKYVEIQNGSDIYRCVLDDGKLVMKFINMVKALYELGEHSVSVNM